MAGLASPIGELRPAYDAVVVGSGYGGGVAASRLARMGLAVAVLERGREFLPGDFPRDPLAAQRELQISGEVLGRPYHVGARSALVDVRVGDDVHVVQGCGLGGTSLFNANVCLAPDDRVFDDAAWPAGVRMDRALLLGYARARGMLQPERLPDTANPLKIANLERSAAALGAAVTRVPLHIAFEPRTNAAGVLQPACTLCGDCMGGCNVGAKTTVHSSYLADAVAFGARLFTEAGVRSVERLRQGGWRVLMTDIAALGTRDIPVRAVTARIVVIAAGTLGTTEIRRFYIGPFAEIAEKEDHLAAPAAEGVGDERRRDERRAACEQDRGGGEVAVTGRPQQAGTFGGARFHERVGERVGEQRAGRLERQGEQPGQHPPGHPTAIMPASKTRGCTLWASGERAGR